jgi:hypothetical protein
MTSVTNTTVGTTVGENDHVEYDWHLESKTAEDLKERLVQLYFQLVRLDGRKHKNLSTNYIIRNYKSLIGDTMRFGGRNIVSNHEHILFVSHMMMLLRAMPTQTRDIVSGKGERTLGYHLLLSWEDIDPAYVRRTVKYWVVGSGEDKTIVPPGSWKDIRNICSILKEQNGGKTDHPLIDFLLCILCDQLREDDSKEEGCPISLAAKWTPREKSKEFGWMFHRLGVLMFGEPHVASSSRNSRLLRKRLASLNRRIDTTEIKQCGKHWADIDFTHVTSVTLQKQKRAFSNIRRTGTFVDPKTKTKRKHRHDKSGTGAEGGARSTDEDRILCAKHFEEHVGKAEKGETKVKASRTSLYDLVRDAMTVCNNRHGRTNYWDKASIEARTLEEQWKDNGRQVHAGLPPMICMADVSGSMTCDNSTPLFNCIGLSLRATEKTVPAFRNKIMTFSHSPTWVEFTEEQGFIERVELLSKAEWGYNTNLYAGMNLILRILIEKEVPPSDVENLVFAIFSDMQFDTAVVIPKPENLHEDEDDDNDRKNINKVALDNIRAKFVEAGYRPPHILFWNLRSTYGFPAVSSDENVSMVSGYSPALLNVLEESGIEGLKGQTPFAMVSKILENPRFTV